MSAKVTPRSLLAGFALVISACGSPATESVAEHITEAEKPPTAASETAKKQKKIETAIRPAGLPVEIWLPEDSSILFERDYGTLGYLLSVNSNQTSENLLQEYRTRLNAAGYNVWAAERVATPTQIIFDGRSLNNGSIEVIDNGNARQIQIGFALDAN